MLVTDPGDAAGSRLDIEIIRCPDQDTPGVNALLLALRDIGFNHVAGLEPEVNHLVEPVPGRESKGVATAHVPIAMAGGFCDQRGHAGRDADADARFRNTGGINPMLLLKTLGGSVEFAQARQMLLQQGVRLPRVDRTRPCVWR